MDVAVWAPNVQDSHSAGTVTASQLNRTRGVATVTRPMCVMRVQHEPLDVARTLLDTRSPCASPVGG